MKPAMTLWERERLQALAKIRQFEREKALRDIVLLMQHHEVTPDELKLLLRDAERRTCPFYLD